MVDTSADGFTFGKDFLVYFLGFWLGIVFPLWSLVPVSGSGVGLQLEELERLHEVGLRTSFRELSTERGLLRDEEDVVPPNIGPLPLPRVGLEGLLSEEKYSRDRAGDNGE